MKTGHRWLALDADFMFNPFTTRLRDRFGSDGVLVFLAFLCACKRSPVPGTITYTNDVDALIQFGLQDLDLVDNEGNKWSLEDLWKFTGTQKQTQKRRHGSRWKLTSSRWEAWQKGLRTEENTERMAAFRRAQDANGTHTGCAPNANGLRTEKRSRSKGEETPPTPPRGERVASPQNVNGQGGNDEDFVRVDPATVTATLAAMRGPEPEIHKRTKCSG